MPAPGPITQAAAKELDAQLAALPSTGKGAAHITLANDGARVDIAARWNTHLATAAYWQKAPQQKASWGARLTAQW